MTKQILTSKGAARELRKSNERVDWCFLHGYYCADVELTCTADEAEEFEHVFCVSLESDEMHPELFAAFRRFLRV